jgi:HlyD family secretion protein
MTPPLINHAKKITPWVIGVAASAAIGTIATVYLSRPPQPPNIDLAKDTVEVKATNLVMQIKANGIVQPLRKVNLSPREGGRIARLYIREGDRVQTGQLLAQMDSEQTQAQVAQYQALRLKATADLSQKRQGERPELIAEATARVASQRAAVAAAQSKLARATDELRRNQALADSGAIARNNLENFLSRQQETQTTLAAEQARLNEQQTALQRLKNGTRPGDIAQAEADVAQAAAQVKLYETQLRNTQIRAPFSGIVSRRFADVGDFVAPTTTASSSDGATSASIAELSSGLEIEAKVPEASIAQIKPGQTVEVRSDSYPQQAFTARVRLIAPRAIQENNITSFRIKVRLLNGLDILKSGMNVKLTFIGRAIANATVVPLAAISTQKDGQKGVWLVDNTQQARYRLIQLGSSSGTQAQVLSGVKPGDRIFLSPPPGVVLPGVDNVGGAGI